MSMFYRTSPDPSEPAPRARCSGRQKSRSGVSTVTRQCWPSREDDWWFQSIWFQLWGKSHGKIDEMGYPHDKTETSIWKTCSSLGIIIIPGFLGWNIQNMDWNHQERWLNKSQNYSRFPIPGELLNWSIGSHLQEIEELGPVNKATHLTCQKWSNSWFVYQSIRRWNDFGTLSSCLKVTSNSNGSLPLTWSLKPQIAILQSALNSSYLEDYPT